MIELRSRGLSVSSETEIVVRYRGEMIGRHRLDLVVGDRLIIELKTVEAPSAAHYAQLRSYLKATGFPVGLLVNFAKEKVDFRRIEGDGSPPSPSSP